MAGKKKRFCKNGHKLNRENTYRRKNGTRECRECSRLRSVEQKKTLSISRGTVKRYIDAAKDVATSKTEKLIVELAENLNVPEKTLRKKLAAATSQI